MKYRISASPGSPLRDGGSVFLTWLLVLRATSSRKALKFVCNRLLLLQSLLNGNYVY